MEGKRASSLLLFSLFTLVVCNNVKAAERRKVKLITKPIPIKTEKDNEVAKENTGLRYTLLRTYQAFEDYRSAHDDGSGALDECQSAVARCEERSVKLANQLQRAIKEQEESDKEQKKSDKFADGMRSKLLELSTELSTARPLLKEYKKMGSPDKLKKKLATLKRMSRAFQIIFWDGESNVDITQSIEEINHNASKLAENHHTLVKKFHSLQSKHKDLENKHLELHEDLESKHLELHEDLVSKYLELHNEIQDKVKEQD